MVTSVTSAQASTADVFGLRQRLAQVEGENTRLKGQLSHAEVREFVVTGMDCDILGMWFAVIVIYPKTLV